MGHWVTAEAPGKPTFSFYSAFFHFMWCSRYWDHVTSVRIASRMSRLDKWRQRDTTRHLVESSEKLLGRVALFMSAFTQCFKKLDKTILEFQPGNRLRSGGKRHKTGSNRKNIGKRREPSGCLRRGKGRNSCVRGVKCEGDEGMVEGRFL